MTAAVPDSFRDQLAERLIDWWAESGDVDVEEVRAVNDVAAQAYADALIPLIAAEVQAGVQAAANQRAAEELRAAAEDYWRDVNFPIARYPEVREWLRARAAALAGKGSPQGDAG